MQLNSHLEFRSRRNDERNAACDAQRCQVKKSNRIRIMIIEGHEATRLRLYDNSSSISCHIKCKKFYLFRQVHGDVGHATKNARTFVGNKIGRTRGTKWSIFRWFFVNAHRFYAGAGANRWIGAFVPQLRRRHRRFTDRRRSWIYDNVSQTSYTICTEVGGRCASSSFRRSNYRWFYRGTNAVRIVQYIQKWKVNWNGD